MNRLLTTLMGLASFGIGITGMVTPGLLSKILGLKVESSDRFLLRAIGARDSILGVGILSHRNEPKEAAFWVGSLGAVVSVDAFGRVVNLKRTSTSEGPNAIAKAEAIQSVVVALVCFLVSFRLSKQDKKK